MSASSLSVALMVCSICSLVTPSIVVGIWVGSEVGWPLLTVTTPSDLAGESAETAGAGCAKARTGSIIPDITPDNGNAKREWLAQEDFMESTL